MSLKFYQRLGIYKNVSGKVSFNPNTFEARSYGWWQFVRKIKGKLVFNNYHYSATTGRHQYQMRALLRELGIKIDVVVTMPDSLSEFESSALIPVYREIFELQALMETKGTRKTTNKERAKRVVELKKQIKVLRALGAKLSVTEIKTIHANVISAMAWKRKRKQQQRAAAAPQPTLQLVRA